MRFRTEEIGRINYWYHGDPEKRSAKVIVYLRPWCGYVLKVGCKRYCIEDLIFFRGVLLGKTGTPATHLRGTRFNEGSYCVDRKSALKLINKALRILKQNFHRPRHRATTKASGKPKQRRRRKKGSTA